MGGNQRGVVDADLSGVGRRVLQGLNDRIALRDVWPVCTQALFAALWKLFVRGRCARRGAGPCAPYWVGTARCAPDDPPRQALNARDLWAWGRGRDPAEVGGCRPASPSTPSAPRVRKAACQAGRSGGAPRRTPTLRLRRPGGRILSLSAACFGVRRREEAAAEGNAATSIKDSGKHTKCLI